MLRYVIDQDRGLVVVSASETVNAAQLRAVRQELKSDPGYSSLLPVLLDLSSATTLDFSAAELRQLATSVMTHPSARQAIVVGTDLGFGLARMFEAYSAAEQYHENLRVFRDVAEARRWVLSAADRR